MAVNNQRLNEKWPNAITFAEATPWRERELTLKTSSHSLVRPSAFLQSFNTCVRILANPFLPFSFFFLGTACVCNNHMIDDGMRMTAVAQGPGRA